MEAVVWLFCTSVFRKTSQMDEFPTPSWCQQRSAAPQPLLSDAITASLDTPPFPREKNLRRDSLFVCCSSWEITWAFISRNKTCILHHGRCSHTLCRTESAAKLLLSMPMWFSRAWKLYLRVLEERVRLKITAAERENFGYRGVKNMERSSSLSRDKK